MEEKKEAGKKKKRIKTRALSELALKDLSEEEMARINAGLMSNKYECPGDCSRLHVETSVKGSLFLVSLGCKKGGEDLTVKLPAK